MTDFNEAHEIALNTIRGEVLGCREDMPDGGRCFQPADYVLWGKLFPAEGLGPRCYKHAALHVHYSGLRAGTDYALINIDDLARALAAQFAEADALERTQP